jgi:hypothetical protein
VALIDQLLYQHTDRGVATMLNAHGYVSGTGRPFQGRIVQHIRRDYQHGSLRPSFVLTVTRYSSGTEDAQAA